MTTAVPTDRLWPARFRHLSLGRSVSIRLDLRAILVTVVLLVLVVAVSVWALLVGEFKIPYGDVIGAFTGGADDGVRRVVLEWRLPRVLLAVLGGAALGMSGAIFQSITRNPLGSPDVIGFTVGAYTGALIAILVIGGNYLVISAGALIGGVAPALVVFLLAFNRGVQGFRLIVVGIAVSALLSATNTYLLLRARLEEAIAASTWGAGSFNDATWNDVVPVVIGFVVLLPFLVVLIRPLRMLEMGDDSARALGIHTERTRFTAVVVGVALIAGVTAAVGPIAFVALAAPQLANRLTRAPGVSLMPAAAMGALLTVVSDLIARTVVAPSQLPAGIVTICIGGAYLVWLLLVQARKV